MLQQSACSTGQPSGRFKEGRFQRAALCIIVLSKIGFGSCRYVDVDLSFEM